MSSQTTTIPPVYIITGIADIVIIIPNTIILNTITPDTTLAAILGIIQGGHIGGHTEDIIIVRAYESTANIIIDF